MGFDHVPGWCEDAHGQALSAFVRSEPGLAVRAPGHQLAAELLALCSDAKALLVSRGEDNAAARAFFERRFQPHAVDHDANGGLFTGYYEPVLRGSRTCSGQYPIPLLRRPQDLVTLIDDAHRAVAGDVLTHARASPGGTVKPYPTRREIENGALAGMELAFVYLDDHVDAFFLHIQGSGVIALDDGSEIRVGYDGKNGHPYTSVGQYVLSRGDVSASEMTLDRLKAWLRADVERGRAAMWRNRSYIFFRELGPVTGTTTLGARTIPLTAGRSLAVDANVHELGLPIFVSSPDLSFCGQRPGFARLMIAQDVGSAIRGPERADIFYGTGDQAGTYAGSTKHHGTFVVLLPNDVGVVDEAS